MTETEWVPDERIIEGTTQVALYLMGGGIPESLAIRMAADIFKIMADAAQADPQ